MSHKRLRKIPKSKYARRRLSRRAKGPKTEAELRQAKNIREARRRKRRIRGEHSEVSAVERAFVDIAPPQDT